MRAAHAANPEAATAGVDVTIGGVGDMRQVGWWVVVCAGVAEGGRFAGSLQPATPGLTQGWEAGE